MKPFTFPRVSKEAKKLIKEIKKLSGTSEIVKGTPDT